MSFLNLQNVSLIVEQKPLIQNLNWQVNQGEFWCVLGPNGAGKTTLIKLLNGTLKDYTGNIVFHGRSLTQWPLLELALNMATLEQESSFIFPYTAHDIVLMGRYAHQKGWFGFESQQDAAVINQVMQKTQCWEFASRSMGSLSGGERKRVLLARTLAQEPQLLLLDEPEAHLDLKYQLEFFFYLETLNKQEGLTLVCAVHQLDLAMRYASHVLLMDGGRLVAAGPKDSVLTSENLKKLYQVDFEKMTPFEGASYWVPCGLRNGT